VTTPLIAVSAYHLGSGRVTHWGQGGFAVPELYVQGLRRAGARPVLLTWPDEADPSEVLEPFDGLLLVGGGDVDPALYNATPHKQTSGVDRDRDEFEIALSRTAAEHSLPTLAICRGIQVANVAFGGTLRQHLPDLGITGHGAPTEADGYVSVEVQVEPGSRLAEALGAARVTGRCSHHQAVDSPGENLRPVAWSNDGVLEGLERSDGWFVCVQWHPEISAAEGPQQQILFDALVTRALAWDAPVS